MLQQNQNVEDYEILSTHFGLQVTRIRDEIESWLNFSDMSSMTDEKNR